jgi:hypothetical protein
MQHKNCKVCLVEHDSEIHDATLRLHEWLRERVKQSIEEPLAVEAASSAA